MIIKYSLFALFALIFITASDPYFGTEFSPIPSEETSDVRELSWRSVDRINYYLEDRGNRVDDAFKITEFYYPMVKFWFLIYTQFESNQVVVHDKNNMNLIYKVLDYSSLKEKDLPLNTRYILQQKISTEKLSSLKEDLIFLSHNPFSLEARAKAIYRSLLEVGIKVPIARKERAAFFKELSENVRTQTGQKNFIRDGVIRSQPYQTFLSKYFKGKKLPIELTSIPFLESSFNPRAHSKANALGAWQFMPLIASYFVPKRSPTLDYRANVGVASVSAGFLLAENYQILKSWDLAVTAYNSGTKHLLKTKRELASIDVDLEAVIKHSDSEHFGFASKNFYSEFLALTRALAYREELFSDLHKQDRTDIAEDLKFYMTKCALRLDRVLNKSQLDDVEFHNHQLKSLTKTAPRGLIITTKGELPSSKFKLIDERTLFRVRPKDWKLNLNQSCSTR